MNKQLLESGFSHFGLKLTEKMAKGFEEYMHLLLLWNQKINLTRIVEPDEVVLKHFIDSVSCAPHIKPEASLIDVGSGAGFPGLPLKIAREDIRVTLLDSLAKRTVFLDEVINTLSLGSVETIHFRAEDGGRSPLYREKFDVATARAVANLSVLCEYCMPFVKVGGIFIGFKGRDVQSEILQSKNAVKTLGGEIVDVCEVFFGGMEHNLIIIKKIAPTPAKYPRKAGNAAKNPII